MARRRLEGLAALALIGALSATSTHAQEAAPAPAPAPAAVPAAGEAAVEEIIVTSRLREESIQDVPLAVSQFGAEAIESLAPNTLRDFDGLTPNVFIGMNTAGPGASAIYIRGIGYADIEKTQTPNVGVVIDGVFVPSSTGQLIDTFDIEAIEVNRGPQAILWGRNTSGGTIVVRRGQPELGEWGAKLLTSYGDYHGEGDGGAFKIQAVANIPLVQETVALRLGYTFKDEDGYSINERTGEDRGAVDYNAINAKLLWQPVEELSVLLNWDWIEDRSDIPPQDPVFDGNDPYVNRSDRVPKELAPYNVSLVSMEVNYDLPFDMRVTAISSYWDSHDLVYQDFDGGFSDPANPVTNDASTVFARLHTRREQEFDVFSQELRLAGSAFDESLHYVAGFYYARDDHDHSQRTEQQLQLVAAAFGGACVPGIPGFSGPTHPVLGLMCVLPTTFSSQETHLTNKSWALFGSLEYELPFIEGLKANFGMRYIDEQKDFDTRFDQIANNNIVGSVLGANILNLTGQEGSWDDVVFEAGGSYQVLDEMLVYYRYAQGFRSGGFSLRGSQPTPTCTPTPNPTPPPTFLPCTPPTDARSWALTFNPENTDSHEVGLKTAWFDGRLVANFAGFFTKLKGAQGSSIISGITPVGTNTLILNGGLAEVYGLELQSLLEVIEGLNVDFTLGWQKGESKTSTQSTHNLPSPAGDTVCNATSGIPKEEQSVATCPVLTFTNLPVARTPELTWSIGANYRLELGRGELSFGSRVRHNDFFWIIPPTGTNAPVPQEGYTLWDANISYEFDVMERALRVGFVGKNLLDKQYKEQALPLGPHGFQGWGPPRYLGGELQIEL